MVSKGKKPLEKELYEPIRKYLEASFKKSVGSCHLEITSEGNFSQELKRVVRHDIIFYFLGKKASPDITGFTWVPENPWLPILPIMTSSVKEFITVEVKRETITLQDVYQAKMYGDLFQAKYTLLISPEPIPEEIKRLQHQLFLLNRFMRGCMVYLGSWSESTQEIKSWFPKSPFPSSALKDFTSWLSQPPKWLPQSDGDKKP